jgi:hypothetical protein
VAWIVIRSENCPVDLYDIRSVHSLWELSPRVPVSSSTGPATDREVALALKNKPLTDIVYDRRTEVVLPAEVKTLTVLNDGKRAGIDELVGIDFPKGLQHGTEGYGKGASSILVQVCNASLFYVLPSNNLSGLRPAGVCESLVWDLMEPIQYTLRLQERY